MRIRAELRFKNEELISRRLLAGYKTQAALAKALGVAPATISTYETFRAIPRNPTVIKRIERRLHCHINEVFPDYIKKIAKKLKPQKKVIDFYSLKPYMVGGLLPQGPEEAYELKELKDFIVGPLETLTEREQTVLIHSFGLHGKAELTYKEIGDIFHVSPERIRQIRAKALRKLKHPGRAKDLKCVLGEDYFKSLKRMEHGYPEPEPAEIEEEEIEEEAPEETGPPPPWLDGREDGVIHKPQCRPDCPVCGGIEYKLWRENDEI